MADSIPAWALEPPPLPQGGIPAWAQDGSIPSSNAPNQSDAQFWHNLGAEEPGYTYGNFLPVKKNNATGDLSLTTTGPVARGIGDLLQMADTKSTDMTPDSLNAMAALATIPSLAEGAASKIGAALADKTPQMGLMESQSSVPGLAPSSASYKPEDYQSAINSTYEAARASTKPFYDFMNKAASGQTIDVSSALAPTEKVISEIENDPFHPARPMLGKLNDFVQTYKDNPQMPLADAVELQQDVNSYFKSNQFNQPKSPYFQVSHALDAPIEEASKINPIFGSAKDLADKNYVNNVALPFTQNKVLKAFWQPQDYYASNSLKNGLAEYLPDETRQRASAMLQNVKTPEQLDAVTRVMPPEMASQFRNAVLQNTTSGAGMYRIQQLGNMLGEPLAAPKHLFNAVKGQPYSEGETALIGASKQPSPVLPDYKLQLNALKSALPSDTRLLTYQPQVPEPEMIAGQQGITQATPQQLLAAQMNRQNAGQMGMYPAEGIQNPENIAPAQAAASQGESPMLSQYGSAKLLGNENIPPIADSNSAGMMGNAELIKAQKMLEAKKLSDMMQAAPMLDASRKITPEEVQSIFNQRRNISNIMGNTPKNDAMMEALLAAFKRSNQ